MPRRSTFMAIILSIIDIGIKILVSMKGQQFIFQLLMVTCITLYINMVACLLSIALMNQRKK